MISLVALALTPAPVAWLTLFPLMLLGIIAVITPHWRRGILFGVSVPLDFAQSAQAQAVLSTYRTAVIALAVLLFASTMPDVARHAPWLATTSPLLLLLGNAALWMHARRRIQPYAILRPLERRASLASSSSNGQALLLLTPFALLPLALSGLYLRSHWNEIPARFPRHWNAQGIVDSWGTRTPHAVAMPLVLGAGVVLLMCLMAALLAWAPMVERQQGRRLLAPLTAGATWLVALIFSASALLPLVHGSHLGILIAGNVALFALMLGIILWSARSSAANAHPDYDSTPDAAWHAGGLVYYNPNDAAVLVPKRVGWGWTINFGHRTSVWYVAGVLLLSFGFVLVPLLMK